jgi:hypothetical protein
MASVEGGTSSQECAKTTETLPVEHDFFRFYRLRA